MNKIKRTLAVASCARMDFSALRAVAPPPIIKYWAKLGIFGVNSSLFICFIESGCSSSAKLINK